MSTNDLVLEKNLSYERYEELIVKRDQLRKDAMAYEISYIREFGQILNDIFKTKIECIRLKKTITMAMQMINYGETVDFSVINRKIDREMTAYNSELKDMIKRFEAAKKAKTSSSYVVEQVKRIYRRIAKLVHPDSHPEFAENKDAQELWLQVLTAYGANDLETMEDLEFMARRFVDENGEGRVELTFAELEERIERLEREIDQLLKTEPYIFGEILNDDEKCAAVQDEFEKEYEEYRAYLKQLSEKLDHLIEGKDVNMVWVGIG